MQAQISDVIREVGPQDAYATLDSFRVIDLREIDEFDGPLGFIRGAELLGRSPIEAQCESFCAATSLLLVCRSGRRSANACSYLQDRGASNVSSLRGGMIAWNRAGLPVIRSEISTLAKLKVSIVAWVGLVMASSSSDARAMVDALILEAGVSIETPTTAALNYALDELSYRMNEMGAPLDLDLVLDAYRRDLAVL